MYRIDNATADTSLPTPAAVGVNPNGYFTKGNPGTGTPATIVDDDWANAVQEEICYVIEQAGLTLDKTVRTQLLQAIELIAQKDIALYTTSSTSPNTYTATLAPAPAAYGTGGMIAFVKFTHASTGAATINFNSLGAKSIKKLDGTAIGAGDIADGMIAGLIYDGTNFQMISSNYGNFVTLAQHQNDSPTYTASTTAANTYTASLTPAPIAYTAGMRVSIKFTNANTGAATINLNSLGAIAIGRGDSSPLLAGDIPAGLVAVLVYDGTNFQLANPLLATPGNGLARATGNVLSRANTLTAVSSVTTLSTGAYSTVVACTGSSAYTVTLPAVSAGKFIDFQILTTSHALITVAPASGTISGQSTIIAGSGDAFRLYSDGSNWFIANIQLAPASFVAYCGSAQSIATATFTKVQMNTVLFDIGTFFDNVTNFRYTPLLPGKYRTGGSCSIALNTNTFASTAIYKNGAAIAENNIPGATYVNATSAPLIALTALNGSTDYLEIFGAQNSGGSKSLVTGLVDTWFEGHRVSLF